MNAQASAERKVAYVTGGASGIGRECALELARTGYAVAVMDTDEAGAVATANACRGTPAKAYRVDVADWEGVRFMVEAACRELGPPDALVNSAGILRMGRIAEMPLDDWSATMRVNVDGVFHMCRAVVPLMVSRSRGRIVNISSWFGKTGKPHFGAYCASKFAIIGLTQSLALEVAGQGVNVNAVCPGTVVNTEMRKVADAGARLLGLPTAKEREAAIPLGRAAEPADIARVARFLLSDDAAYMTGQSVTVCGGLWPS
jgi:NAD(P)-dependent dehydrogenase (short-subunit alcohol dehydrogenase family)